MRWVVICRFLALSADIKAAGAMNASQPDALYRPDVNVADGLSKDRSVSLFTIEGYSTHRPMFYAAKICSWIPGIERHRRSDLTDRCFILHEE